MTPPNNTITSRVGENVNVKEHFYINDNGVHKYFDSYNCKVQIVNNPNKTDPDESGISKLTTSETAEKGVTDYMLLTGYIDSDTLELYGEGLNELLTILDVSEIPLIVIKAE